MGRRVFEAVAIAVLIDLAKRLADVQQHGPTTAREIAREVLGGSGNTRTPARGMAQVELTALVRLGSLTRHPRNLSGHSGYVYAATSTK